MNKDEMSVYSFNPRTQRSPREESAVSTSGGYSFRKHVFKIQLESDKSVYFSMPFITAVNHHRAFCMGLKLIWVVCSHILFPHNLIISVCSNLNGLPFWNMWNFLLAWTGLPGRQNQTVNTRKSTGPWYCHFPDMLPVFSPHLLKQPGVS